MGCDRRLHYLIEWYPPQRAIKDFKAQINGEVETARVVQNRTKAGGQTKSSDTFKLNRPRQNREQKACRIIVPTKGVFQWLHGFP